MIEPCPEITFKTSLCFVDSPSPSERFYLLELEAGNVIGSDDGSVILISKEASRKKGRSPTNPNSTAMTM